MQNIRVGKAQTPAKNMPQPHLGMHPVYRVLQSEKRKNTEYNRAARPHPQRNVERLLHRYALHAKHGKHHKQYGNIPGGEIHRRRQHKQQNLGHRFPFCIRRQQKLQKAHHKGGRRQKNKNLLPLVKSHSLGQRQQNKKAVKKGFLQGYVFIKLCRYRFHESLHVRTAPV